MKSSRTTLFVPLGTWSLTPSPFKSSGPPTVTNVCSFGTSMKTFACALKTSEVSDESNLPVNEAGISDAMSYFTNELYARFLLICR